MNEHLEQRGKALFVFSEKCEERTGEWEPEKSYGSGLTKCGLSPDNL